MELNLEKVKEKYKLSEKEHKEIGESINEIMLLKKISVQKPIAIINIAPPGSGKTGLNGYALKQINNNSVIINSDEFKPFHPKIEEIAKLYPQYYTKITNQESNSWTDNLFEEAVKKNYNIIFEGTGRNLKLLKKMIEKMIKYNVIVRSMAVNELNCLMSIVERYEGQVKEKGWGRLVTIEHFYQAYEEILDTIQEIEKNNITKNVEVYTRGKKILEYKKIYSNKNKEFIDAREAIIMGRKNDSEVSGQYFEQCFNKREIINSDFKEKKELVEKINDLYYEKENRNLKER